MGQRFLLDTRCQFPVSPPSLPGRLRTSFLFRKGLWLVIPPAPVLLYVPLFSWGESPDALADQIFRLSLDGGINPIRLEGSSNPAISYSLSNVLESKVLEGTGRRLVIFTHSEDYSPTIKNTLASLVTKGEHLFVFAATSQALKDPLFRRLDAKVVPFRPSLLPGRSPSSYDLAVDVALSAVVQRAKGVRENQPGSVDPGVETASGASSPAPNQRLKL